MSDQTASKTEHADEHPPLEDIEITSINADFVSGLVVFCVALYAFIDSYAMPSFGTPDEAAYNTPGLTPMLVSGILVILSVALMFRSRGVSFADMHFGGFGGETRRVLMTFGIILVFVIVMPFIGYAPATFLLLFAFQTVFARKRSLFFVLVWGFGLSAVLTGTLYYVFANVFMIPLP